MYAVRLNARNGQQLAEYREASFPEGFEIVALAGSDSAELPLNPHWTTHKANAPASDTCLSAMWADSAIVRDNRDGALYVVDRATAEE